MARLNRFEKQYNLQNLDMNQEVYKKRRKVIDLIYEAKELHELPRIRVRITNGQRHSAAGRQSLGTANMIQGKTEIWIAEQAINESKETLRWVVYHEILHTVFGAQHRETGLMQPTVVRNRSKAEVQQLYLNEIKRLKGDA